MPPEQTRRKRMVGRYMEALRKRHDPTLIPERAAALADTSRTTISRLENGQQLPNKHLFAALLTVYGATDEERAEAMALWTHARQATLAIKDVDDTPAKYIAFRRDEADAVAELTINYIALPGLLQTNAYARAASSGDPFDTIDEVLRERRAAERERRRQLLEMDKPLALHAIVSEAVLRMHVGGPGIMADQLRHLLVMAAKDNVTIQVMPFAAGSFGPMNGPVVLLRFDDDPVHSHTVYLEYPLGGETVDRKATVAVFLEIFEAICVRAMSPEDSISFMRSVLSDLEEML
ncbi:transcriptional regulator with XRE-family HTH domain [Actinokineospora baliensis]|uniref:helix-turn-helix domain-containing protein n=1 Tax=Actinokineospora baliensis TaxID=547056 RepID=UPI001959D0DC|nr:helix-turn-helix transcriptional regulator [Actinokineospora baliensis]MBM7771605.1 transcriptional regulator with XRE-family HTH domain [Actinokineospora baliensis]